MKLYTEPIDPSEGLWLRMYRFIIVSAGHRLGMEVVGVVR